MKHLEQDKFIRAKSKVEKLRQFYSHVAIYLVVNVSLAIVKVVRNMMNGETFQEAFFDFSLASLWFIWGIVLLIHAFATFGMDYILGKNWEEKRIQKYIDEENEYKNY